MVENSVLGKPIFTDCQTRRADEVRQANANQAIERAHRDEYNKTIQGKYV